MKLVSYEYAGQRGLGKVVGERVIPLNQVLPELPRSMAALLAAGAEVLAQVERVQVDDEALEFTQIRLLPPVTDPQKYLAIGMNYKAHAEEAARNGVPIPKSQLWFNKQVSCLNGPFDPVEMPKVSDKLDYEAELGVVIGKRCRHVSVAEAASVVAGYLVCNDVSVRDWQMRSPTFTLGKSFDTHGPIGPWLVTADEVPDPHNLMMRCWVNGELRQETNTGDMIYNIWEQIAYLSTVMTLEPGDILATGTPAGVGVGFDPKRFLAVDDVVRIEVEGLGYIENRVVAEK
ncbi:fumarylacetoacetate hydrolase family protein [Halopseudomonas phragmitis]|uniref:5-carboxymethyl-2-hydroxymuconate isomerase n=1 Tax=Halopseudomonas phragmitis TaxID=1931241 RepID=A0A1V0B8H3_9GAMM|nr:fumarylacetoacetate hydrolase family protein [Halopseudomonas phragmitis]AQZ96222.1 5-carboxymethyl-2-hydroxymuconate isomerase [Halopseudomonas phragmitis]